MLTQNNLVPNSVQPQDQKSAEKVCWHGMCLSFPPSNTLLHFCCSNFSALALIQLRLPTRNCILVLPGREEIVSFAAMAKFSPFIGTQFIMVTWLSIFDREIGNQNSSMENMSSRSACARPVDCKLVQVGENNNKSRKCVLFAFA